MNKCKVVCFLTHNVVTFSMQGPMQRQLAETEFALALRYVALRWWKSGLSSHFVALSVI